LQNPSDTSWTKLADFYQRSANAAKLAQEAGRIEHLDEFRKPIGQLQQDMSGPR
jgi:hypothetical protein